MGENLRLNIKGKTESNFSLIYRLRNIQFHPFTPFATSDILDSNLRNFITSNYTVLPPCERVIGSWMYE